MVASHKFCHHRIARSLKEAIRKRQERVLMIRKTLVSLLAAFFLATVSSASAQQPNKVFRIGYLSGTDRETDAPRAEGTRWALRDLGYIEGQNIIIEYRHAEGKAGRNAELAAERLSPSGSSYPMNVLGGRTR